MAILTARPFDPWAGAGKALSEFQVGAISPGPHQPALHGASAHGGRTRRCGPGTAPSVPPERCVAPRRPPATPAPCAAAAACEGALGQGERRPGLEGCVRGLTPAPYRGVRRVRCRTRRCVGRWGRVGSLGPSSLCRNGGWVSNSEGTAGLLRLLLQVGGCRALMPGVITVVSNPRG